ncbi:unnamed protein product [Sphagnum troendelagicum]|uniref:Uncharacterized protein n=1 Tax=Sphagnum troendelagicum TaxID=128251 RepID=A0ABP0UD49_9BRYO
MVRSRMAEGLSPWVTATILGIILLITTLPYSSRPGAPVLAIAYQSAPPIKAAYSGSLFLLRLLWLPVLLIVLFEWFIPAGSWKRSGQFHAVDGYGRPAYSYADRTALRAAPAYNSRGGSSWSRSRYERPSWTAYHKQNNYTVQNWFWTSFMEFGGHWVLIFLGIMVFSIVVGWWSTAYYYAVPSSTYAFSFPWSLFLPWWPIVVLQPY